MTELGLTPSQTVGPFLSIGLPWADGSDLVADGTNDEVLIRGRVTDGDGEPIPDALIEIWQADPHGRFPHSDDPRGAADYDGFRPFGRCPSDSDGGYWFRTLKPGRVDDSQAPHIDVHVLARGLVRQLVTRIYFPDELDANDNDPVLRELEPADRALLIAAPEADGALRFDIRLQGGDETPFFAV